MSGSDVQRLVQQLDRMESQTGRLESRLDRMDDRLDTVEGHVRRLRDGYDKINGQVSEIHAALFGPNTMWNVGDGLVSRVEKMERQVNAD